jgi:hypothetical protein
VRIRLLLDLIPDRTPPSASQIVSLLSMKRGCARRSVSRQFQHFFPKGLENLMSVVELHAEVLFLLLRVDHAPTLRRDGSIDGLAGRGGFELRAIVTTLLALRTAAEWARFADAVTTSSSTSRPIQNTIERGNRKRGRTQGAADANDVERHHGLGHRLPDRLAMPVRFRQRTLRASPSGGRTNQRAHPAMGA